MAVDQKIVDRVRKLFALAADKANQNESDAALDKAHELMREYGIASVDLEKGTVGDVQIESYKTDWLSQIDTYSRILSGAAAKLFNCESWSVRSGAYNKYRVKMCFAGSQTDVALCVEVWPFLVKTAKKMAARNYGSGWSSSHRSFCEAFALIVERRVAMMVAEANKPPATSDDQKYALVVQKKQQEIQTWFEQNNIQLKSKKTNFRGDRDESAFIAGVDAGSKVNLNFRKSVGAQGENLQLP